MQARILEGMKNVFVSIMIDWFSFLIIDFELMLLT